MMRLVKKWNKNTKSKAYKSLVRPILEYGAACWDPYREGQVNALDRVQNRAAIFAHREGDKLAIVNSKQKDGSLMCTILNM